MKRTLQKLRKASLDELVVRGSQFLSSSTRDIADSAVIAGSPFHKNLASLFRLIR